MKRSSFSVLLMWLLVFKYLTFSTFACCYSSKACSLCEEAGSMQLSNTLPCKSLRDEAPVNSSSIPHGSQAVLMHEGVYPGKRNDVLSYFKLVPALLFCP